MLTMFDFLNKWNDRFCTNTVSISIRLQTLSTLWCLALIMALIMQYGAAVTQRTFFRAMDEREESLVTAVVAFGEPLPYAEVSLQE